MITSASKRSSDFADLLSRLDQRYGPKPGQASRPVVLVLDNGPIHTSKATTQALAARPWLGVEWLPRYAPELNDIERSWRDLKRHYLAHQTFRDVRHLDTAIHAAVRDLNHERNPPMCAVIDEAAQEPIPPDDMRSAPPVGGVFRARAMARVHLRLQIRRCNTGLMK